MQLSDIYCGNPCVIIGFLESGELITTILCILQQAWEKVTDGFPAVSKSLDLNLQF
jgi:hypothetical protein